MIIITLSVYISLHKTFFYEYLYHCQQYFDNTNNKAKQRHMLSDHGISAYHTI